MPVHGSGSGRGECPGARRWLDDFARNSDWRRFAEGRSLTTSVAREFDRAHCSKVRVRVLASFVRASYCSCNLSGRSNQVKFCATNLKNDEPFVGQGVRAVRLHGVQGGAEVRIFSPRLVTSRSDIARACLLVRRSFGAPLAMVYFAREKILAKRL